MEITGAIEDRLTKLEQKLDSLLTGLRQVYIMELGLVEDFQERERTITPRKKRRVICDNTGGN